MKSLIFKESKYQKTKIGLLPHDWKLKKLRDVAYFWNGKAHEQSIDASGDYIVINSKFVSSDGQVAKYCNELISPLKSKDIAIVMSDIPNGKAIAKCFIVEVDERYSLNQRIGGVRSTKVTSEFLYYVLNRNTYFLKFDDGVKQTNLRKDDILNCPVQLPPEDEQKYIANLLINIDRKIELTHKKIDNIQKLKKGLMQKLFSEGIGIQDSKGQWHPHTEYRESPIGKIPVKWSNGKISNYVAELVSGVSVNSDARTKKTNEVGILKTSAVFGGKFNSCEHKTIKQEEQSRATVSVLKDTLIVSRMNTPQLVGEFGYVEDDYEDLFLPDRLWMTRPTKEEHCVKALSYLLQMEPIKKSIKKLATGTSNSMKNISKPKFMSVFIPLIPLEEQEMISDILSTVDRKIILLEQLKAETQQLKKGLMQKLLTGEWRVNIDKITKEQLAVEA
ncbi:restriction endonuclease subunit S [Pseudoalteromonas sp. MMG022]|uniref:restriction endonuclease subunit S n=1 Tax=Pseudoalteromonas sp. MMG022 TaxID=2909978 RepID=UPI001F35E620|nr:restriction endonuclease subunit S [Pseudoalteromonas sp. MMG022]MCF6437182.1 restriction endonuclease subunit S [Pseudoalteromonas sp. MMG022]